ncbi:hypothetical protein E2C01_049397 [Portunus trituberculatus]|uniref:Uncharacterized protein n=1 Tax=Portunus trituberculatus TaxID=210409 RepID=A0A5B7G6A3_PORTR|nr:hypothetical protein [Portunus trituberculatus]
MDERVATGVVCDYLNIQHHGLLYVKYYDVGFPHSCGRPYIRLPEYLFTLLFELFNKKVEDLIMSISLFRGQFWARLKNVAKALYSATAQITVNRGSWPTPGGPQSGIHHPKAGLDGRDVDGAPHEQTSIIHPLMSGLRLLAVAPLGLLTLAAAFYNQCFDLASFIITMPKVPKETGKKKKKVVLTIQQKLEILDKLKAGQSGTVLGDKCVCPKGVRGWRNSSYDFSYLKK